MKKSIIALAILAAASTAFAETSTTTDCGTSPSCVSMGDATSKENTVSQVNPTTASNGNDLGNDNTVKTNITGGNTTSTGGTNTATGGTYTTGALSAQGGSIGNTNNQSSATTGASTSSIGNTSTGASTSSTGEITLKPTNTQGLTDASTRNQNAAANNSAKTGSNTSTTNVDAADRSSTVYQSLAYALPDMPAVVATNLATAQMTKTVGVCGPLVNIRRDQVTGVYQGLVFKTRIDQGHDDTVEAFIDNNGNEQLFKVINVAGRQMLSGHQLHITSAVISLGGARQLGIGGGNVGSDYGQASAGSSSQTQRLVTNVQAVPCVVGMLEAAPVSRIKG